MRVGRCAVNGRKLRAVVMMAVGAVTLGLLVLILRSWAAGKLPVANDLGTMAIPYRVFLSESLKSGTLPLWWPHILGGYDFGAEGRRVRSIRCT